MNDIDTDVAVAIAQEVAAQVGELRYNLWFKDNAKLQVSDNELVVGVPNLFFQEWLNSNFLVPLRRAAEAVTGRRLPVRLVVDGDLFRASRASEDKPPAAQVPPAPAPGPGRRQNRSAKTFDNFVVGAANRMAHAAAMRIAQEPSGQFNPLVLYGPMGLGKTHLLRAITHAAREQYRSLQVQYLAAEVFTNSFLEDMRGGRLNAFRQRLRGVDLLILDDLQFMASKRATQNELLHTFEALDAEGRQVVLACDSHPRHIDGFSDQLVNRLVAGMACPIEPPDYDTRVGILDLKSQSLGLRLSREVLEFVASHFRTNVRELEGAVHCLKAHAEFTRLAIDLPAARDALAELIRHSTKTVTLEEVEQAICQAFEVEPAQLRSSSRSRAVSQPRMLAIYLARKYTGSSYEAIGQHFGGRNHSTIMCAEHKVQEWIAAGTVLKLAGRPWTIGDAIRAIEERLK